MLFEGDRCWACFRSDPSTRVKYEPPKPRKKAVVSSEVVVLMGRVKAEKLRRGLTLRQMGAECGLHKSMVERLLGLMAGAEAYKKALAYFPAWLNESMKKETV